jgi:hypothetical protein
MKKRQEPRPTITGVAWYRPEQWPRLLELSVDQDNLEDTFEEWLRIAEKTFADLKKLGLNIVKVDVDVEELANWCAAEGFPLDSSARSRFVREKVREIYGGASGPRQQP